MTTDRDTIIKLARQIWGEQAVLPMDDLVTFFHAAQKLERGNIVGALNLNPYNLTKSECITVISNRSNP